MNALPRSHTPDELSRTLREIGKLWACSEYRPRIPRATNVHWDKLIDEWATSDLPLVIRKSGGIRGSVVRHTSGRSIVIADNSPAQWSFSRAYEGQLLSLADIRALLDQDAIPFTFATKTSEKALMFYKRTLGVRDNINKLGWKLCHIEDVGLNTSTAMAQLPLSILLEHFRRLMAPSNHFLIPLELAGLGEIQEVIDELMVAERS